MIDSYSHFVTILGVGGTSRHLPRHGIADDCLEAWYLAIVYLRLEVAAERSHFFEGAQIEFAHYRGGISMFRQYPSQLQRARIMVRVVANGKNEC